MHSHVSWQWVSTSQPYEEMVRLDNDPDALEHVFSFFDPMCITKPSLEVKEGSVAILTRACARNFSGLNASTQVRSLTYPES